MLELKNVSFGYKDKLIINNFNYNFNSSTSYALVGKSGCGKTTLLNLIAGIIEPDTGKIELNGGKPKSIAYTFQSNSLFPWLTIIDNLKLANENNTEIQDVLKKLNMLDLSCKYPKELSGGQLQRANIARSLLCEPDLLLFDEPTSSLDSDTKEMIDDYIIRLCDDVKSVNIFVTHDIEEALLISQEILIIENGIVKKVVNSEFYGQIKNKGNIDFYKKCIELRGDLK